jgi:hypothetical protein
MSIPFSIGAGQSQMYRVFGSVSFCSRRVKFSITDGSTVKSGSMKYHHVESGVGETVVVLVAVVAVKEQPVAVMQDTELAVAVVLPEISSE